MSHRHTWRIRLDRAFVFAVLLVVLNEASASRIVTIDWMHTETLLMLDAPPVAAAQTDGYDAWVSAPELPPEVVDIGLRTQPNLELLAALSPEKILISPMFTTLTPLLERIAPVESIGLYREGEVSWSAIRRTTRRLAEEVGKVALARQRIREAEAELDRLRLTLDKGRKPLLLIQFMDSNHVRVFGRNSLYRAALLQLGLDTAWQGVTNDWGFSLVGLDSLMGIDAQLVVIDPLPRGTAQMLKHDHQWQHLEAASGLPVLRLDPVWSFGGLPAALRFARLIVTALGNADKANPYKTPQYRAPLYKTPQYKAHPNGAHP